MQYPKFGFVGGVAGNHNGWGDHIRALDAAGFPVTVCTNDGTAGLGDALALINNGSTVPHVLLYRVVAGKDGRGGEYYSVPDYSKEPVEAAHLFWQKIEPHIADEVKQNKQHVWLQVGNELRTKRADGESQWGDLPASEWLGQWSLEMCRIGNAAGYKIAPWGCNSGEPRTLMFNGVDDWARPGMLEFLRYCANNPSKAAVSLHEYSWKTEDIWYGRDGDNHHLIGRFKYMLEACDRHAIGWPQIIITEWGWEKGDVPDPSTAMQHIKEVGELYAAYPNVLGAAIWCLQTYQDDIHHKAQKLIAPLTDTILNTRYSVEIEEPETMPPTEPDGNNEYDTFEEWVWNFALSISPTNADAALQKAIMSHNNRPNVFYPYGVEKWGTFDDVQYAVQPAYNWATDERRAYYAIVPDWGNVRYVGNPYVEFQIIDIVDDLPTNPDNPYPTRPISQVEYITIHHSVSTSTPQAIANYHVNHNDWGGIGYTFLVYADGENGATIYQTNRITTRAVHDRQNDDSVGVCLIGNFQEQPPTTGQMQACNWLLNSVLIPQLPSYKESRPHRKVPGNSTACPGNTWEQWWETATGQSLPSVQPPPDPTPPPTGKLIDVAAFFMPPEQVMYEVQHPKGPTETFQTQYINTSEWYYCKNHLWEYWKIVGDDIMLCRDISPSNAPSDGAARFYEVNDGNGSLYIKRLMRVGETVTDGGHVVQFYRKDNCQAHPDNSGNSANTTTLVAHHPTFTFNSYGQNITLSDVIEVKGNTETHWFALGYGRVAWLSTWGRSEISEIHQGRQPLARDRVCGFG